VEGDEKREDEKVRCREEWEGGGRKRKQKKGRLGERGKSKRDSRRAVVK
jgi:hypothetical protein